MNGTQVCHRITRVRHFDAPVRRLTKDLKVLHKIATRKAGEDDVNDQTRRRPRRSEIACPAHLR